jgi:hypothetical protein
MIADEPQFEQLPVIYQNWVSAWLPAGIPRESNATCDDCAMCNPSGGSLTSDVGYYDRALKCCTFFPELPNFLAGRALAGDGPGAAALRALINHEGGTRGNATLRSVEPDAKYAAVYDQQRKAGFGRDPDLLCPYAVDRDAPAGPRCGIWQYRNSVCTTFFCKHVRGLTGFQFWQTLKGLLGALEWSLSWWAITQVLDRPASAYTAGTTRATEANAIRLRPDAWNLWPGSREAFYVACADRVEALSPEDVIQVAGMSARLHHLELLERFEALMSPRPPDRLRAAPFSILRQCGQRATIQALTCSEPMEAPVALLPVLQYFDGKPTAEAIEAIRETARVRLDPKLVRRLFEFGILEAASE